MKFTKTLFCRMLETALSLIEANLALLNQLDAATGDGDHGTAILAAMKAAVAGSKKDGTLAATLETVGFDVMSGASGSTSTLTGLFFTGMGEAAKEINSEELDVDEIITVFEAGLTNLQTMTKAKVGDKTIMDAQIPAIEAMSRFKGRGTTVSLGEIFHAAADAAKTGSESTKDLAAKLGRARNLGERSRGHLDAGAVSNALIYAAYADCIKKEENV
jgi:dihydroxyacetone kinase-like protein